MTSTDIHNAYPCLYSMHVANCTPRLAIQCPIYSRLYCYIIEEGLSASRMSGVSIHKRTLHKGVLISWVEIPRKLYRIQTRFSQNPLPPVLSTSIQCVRASQSSSSLWYVNNRLSRMDCFVFVINAIFRSIHILVCEQTTYLRVLHWYISSLITHCFVTDLLTSE